MTRAIRGSDVAGNMRVFQNSLLKARISPSVPICARRQAAKAPDCKSGIREFESHRALQFLLTHNRCRGVTPWAPLLERQTSSVILECTITGDHGVSPLQQIQRKEMPSDGTRVAQLTERWSYKPEVEGLSPSLGTKSNYQVIGA